jgi:hypothetical protein
MPDIHDFTSDTHICQVKLNIRKGRLDMTGYDMILSVLAMLSSTTSRYMWVLCFYF